MALDSGAAAMLAGLAQTMPEIGTMSAVEARVALEAVGAMLAAPELINDVKDVPVDVDGATITVRTYRPPGDGPLPAVVYLHGGGWVLGRLADYDALLDAMATRSGCLIASVEYRMAPESKFPVPVEDCYAALAWVADHADEVGVDPARIAVAGDSSGGNLAAAVALMARDRGGPAIALQVLVYPVIDCHLDAAEYPSGLETPPLTNRAMAWYCNEYLARPSDADNPYASPLRSSDLTGLPPALLITAEVDPLSADDLVFAQRLSDAGVSLTHSHYFGVFHGFYSFRGFLPQADQAFEEVVGTLRTRLTPLQ
jgi:acetyl esterase